MAKKTATEVKYVAYLATSVLINILFVLSLFYGDDGVSWSRQAATEAEAVAAISCSGHGRAYLDGMVPDGSDRPVCECHSCYGGADCSHLDPSCVVNVDGGDPLFLEPFWMEHASESALVVSGWHRMSYSYPNQSSISEELEKRLRKLHAIVGNAITHGKYIVFGAGSTQLLNAAVNAFSLDHHNSSSSSPANVVASIPFYPVYKLQTELFESVHFKFQGDTSLWKNKSGTDTNMIEFVTSPNNPDGKLNQAILDGPNAKAIYDRAYYWPHYTPIPSPADDDLMLFTLSKVTGHAGSRFGWALIKDEAIYKRMTQYLQLNTMGASRDTQLRTLKLLKVVLEEEGGREIFEFGHKTMKKRWDSLNSILSMSKRFSLQKIEPRYCTFFHKVREASPAYAWLKCEREEDKDCYGVLKAANIEGRAGNIFYAEDRYVRLSLIRSQDDIDLMLQKMNKLVSEENGLISTI